MIPNTIPEWEAYVASIPNSELRDVAVAANTLNFVRTLQEEGSAGGDVVKILGMFALRFEAQDEAPPQGIPGEYLSYGDLVEALLGEIVPPLFED